MVIRRIVKADAAMWEALRCRLWPDGAADHASEIASFFAGELIEPVEVLVVTNDSGHMIGFSELSIRLDVPGLAGKRAGFVEGLWVIPEARDGKVARALLRASREWAAEQGCEAFASDRAERFIVDARFEHAPKKQSKDPSL